MPDAPVVGDFAGDGTLDYATFVAPDWTVHLTDGTTSTIAWGNPGDVPLAGQVDDDPPAELVVYRPSTGHFYIRDLAATGTEDSFDLVSLEQPDDVPVVGDYDGDGRDEVGVYRRRGRRWIAGDPFTAHGLIVAGTEPGIAVVPGDSGASGVIPGVGVPWILGVVGPNTITLHATGAYSEWALAIVSEWSD